MSQKLSMPESKSCLSLRCLLQTWKTAIDLTDMPTVPVFLDSFRNFIQQPAFRKSAFSRQNTEIRFFQFSGTLSYRPDRLYRTSFALLVDQSSFTVTESVTTHLSLLRVRVRVKRHWFPCWSFSCHALGYYTGRVVRGVRRNTLGNPMPRQW